MVSVRDYFKKKEQRDGDRPPRISYREKIKSHKFTVFYRFSLALVLMVAVGAALYLQWKNKVYVESV